MFFGEMAADTRTPVSTLTWGEMPSADQPERRMPLGTSQSDRGMTLQVASGIEIKRLLAVTADAIVVDYHVADLL